MKIDRIKIYKRRKGLVESSEKYFYFVDSKTFYMNSLKDSFAYSFFSFSHNTKNHVMQSVATLALWVLPQNKNKSFGETLSYLSSWYHWRWNCCKQRHCYEIELHCY